MFIRNNIINKPSFKSGFTLIELLVVIVIIGILATVTMVALNSSRANARDAKRVSDLKQIVNSVELYYADHSAYPVYATAGIALKSADGVKTYMAKVPADPSTNLSYAYGAGSNFTLRAILEKGTSELPAGSIIITNKSGVKLPDNTDARLVDDALNFGGALVGHWALDGNTGTRDLTGNSTTGVIAGGVATSTGRYGEALGGYNFSSANGTVTIADNSYLDMGTGDFSVVASFKTGSTLGGAIFNKGTQGAILNNYWYHCRINVGSSISCYIADGTTTYWGNVSIGGVAINTYYQLVMSLNRSTGRRTLFLNTTPSSQGTDTPNSVNISNSSPLVFGWEANASYFTGSLYEVRLYNRALVQSEVNLLWSATKP